MRRLSLAALLAAPLLLACSGRASANPIESWGFGCGGLCIRMFPGIFQEGPLFNYGPYHGYYPFKPYGPWDAYLRYDPFFYGDPYANWNAMQNGEGGPGGNMYGRNPNFPYLRGMAPGGGVPSLFHKHGCTSCGFWHASWVHGGWFHGHKWLAGGYGDAPASGCASCGGVAVPQSAQPEQPGAHPLHPPTTEPMTRYSGFGRPSQSAVFYLGTPTLNPALDLPPAR
jgi:hypothetical protein